MTDGAHVCVLGSINMDLVVQSPRFAQPGETVLGGVFATFPGGKGANQAIAAARMGARAALIGCVGDDAFGTELLTCLEASGVEHTDVERRDGAATGVGLITIDGTDGENTIIVASGANMLVTVEQVERARRRIEGAGVLLMQLEVPMEANLRAADLARAAHVPVVLNAAPAMALPDALLEATDILVVNRAEASMLSGLDPDAPPSDMIAALDRFGIDRVLITLGADGAVGRDDGALHRIDAARVEAADTVGAGDAFVGALATVLASGGTWEDALRSASAAGGLAVTKRGAIPSLPHRAEVSRLAGSIRIEPMRAAPEIEVRRARSARTP